ncbi:MAG: sugar phosphate nucleotidyltransferase [Sediminibacterium sp.]|nr:MAG: hypothetical protein FD183_212 [Chitinophagaceae bacterium]MDP1843582.1 sugar phosphate nucleotidyltransferase [Sediminibacterium sp.]TXT33855.1 MAG: nucleotidyltransferase [Chitinophagaceae bacterium]
MKAMILAAGLGTRLKPFTDHHPKALAMVNGKSLLERNIVYLQQFGIDEVIVNVHHFADQIINTISANNGWGSVVTISDETKAVLETGGGLQKAAWYFKGDTDFVLMNADILTNMDLGNMIKAHQQNKPLATLAVSERDSSRYLLFNNAMQLVGWRNNSTGEEKGPVLRANDRVGIQSMAFSGIHVISATIFSAIKREGKFSMIDVYLDACENDAVQGFNHTGAILLDVGKPESLEKAATLFN